MRTGNPALNANTFESFGAYRHDGFWQPMDTFQEFKLLNGLWDSGRAPWKVW